jgi:uncharacterized protein (UPF0332 family)
MFMSYSELEKEGLIRKLSVDRRKVEASLRLAKRDLKTAKKILAENNDWAFSIAYNSMLQAGRALMFSKGYRPSGDAQHVSVVRFAEAVLGKSQDIIIVFDRLRRKRHLAVYGTAGLITNSQAKNAIKWAEEFLEKVENVLSSRL